MLELFSKITPLALADSVNPCAIAVLTMVLVSILVENPKDRKRVLCSGLSFILAVFLGYTFYAEVLVQFFKGFASFFAKNSMTVKYILASIAMLIGALNIKDYFFYKKGSFATEMPLFMRPKMKRIIGEITSPRGAFMTGFIITLFLLPCTAGPLVVAAGLLAEVALLKTILWILYYNFLFVLPMLIIVFMIYFGFKEVDDISGWKERNIKKLHLIAGILLFVVGIALINGFI